MTSLWLDHYTPVAADEFVPGATYDTVVVGAGMTGLATALLLARAGQRVAVLEARHVGAVTTGNTTAKLSLLQGASLSNILKRHPLDIAKAYVSGNREGQQWLVRYCEERGIGIEQRDAFSYAGSDNGRETVDAEYDAARQAGLAVTLETDLELPYRTHGAVKLAGQYQLDPMDILTSLAGDFRDHGGVLHENVRVQGVSTNSEGGLNSGPLRTVQTTAGDVLTRNVVLATGTPILDRGGYFAALEPSRSYALAFQVPGEIPQGMYLSVDSPSRSLRTAGTGGSTSLLVGGNGHIVGREPSPRGSVEDLRRWTERHFPGAELTHSWSAQDYRPLDLLPYVGPILPGQEHIFVATGYNKWGMTNSIAAAMTLSGRILGGHMPWADELAHRPLPPATLGNGASLNAKVGAHMVSDWLRTAMKKDAGTTPAEGEGVVVREGVHPVGISTVGGQTRRVGAVCPHMHGILSWNNAEQSWDCPLHGSRFTCAGELLEGPATRNLSRPE